MHVFDLAEDVVTCLFWNCNSFEPSNDARVFSFNSLGVTIDLSCFVFFNHLFSPLDYFLCFLLFFSFSSVPEYSKLPS